MLKNLTRKERLSRNLLKVGEMAQVAGVLTSTIDYYADIGFLMVSDYTQGRYRLFKKDQALARMAKIKKLKNRGLALSEIRKKLS